MSLFSSYPPVYQGTIYQTLQVFSSNFPAQASFCNLLMLEGVNARRCGVIVVVSGLKASKFKMDEGAHMFRFRWGSGFDTV